MRVESFPLSRNNVVPAKPQDLKPVAKPHEEDGKDKPERDRRKDLNRAVDTLNKAAFLSNRHIKFKLHKETGVTIVQVVDNASDKVIGEFPTEKMLDMMASLVQAVGMTIDEYV